MSRFGLELRSQPALWKLAALRASEAASELPYAGQRVCVVGCGTSYYMGRAFAAYREGRCGYETDAFPASEVPTGRSYGLFVALSRSGTTTEVLDVVREVGARTPVLAITAEPSSPLVDLATSSVVLEFADEAAVVQTRFATCALLFLLSGCGWDVEASAARAEKVLSEGPPAEVGAARQYVFLGRGMAAAIASEAALKLRESAKAWAEAYPSMEFRHGPVAAVGEHTLVWSMDPLDPALASEARAAGSGVVSGGDDPLAELVRVHLAAESLAAAAGIDPDAPPNLARSVVISR